MNDEFLYRLREDPPPEFAARLKARLERQAVAAGREPRVKLVRAVAAALLLGATAFAMMSPSVREKTYALIVELRGEEPPANHETSVQHSLESELPTPQSPAPARETAPAPAPAQQVGQPASVIESQPSAATGGAKSAQPGTNMLSPPGVIGGGIPPKTTTTPSAIRTQISIVGSAAVHSYTEAVAERFSRRGDYEPPKIEMQGSGGALKLFCSGIGMHAPDIATAARRISSTELEACAKNRVRDIIEIKIGYDAVVIARSRLSSRFNLTRRHIFRALTRQIPVPNDVQTLFDNPYSTWRQIDPLLPDRSIQVFGPGLTASTRSAFEDLVLEPGCDSTPWIKALKSTDSARYVGICNSVRDDGVYRPILGEDPLIVEKLDADPNAIAFVSYSLLRKHETQLDASPLEGVAPIFETIEAGSYPASRTLYVYVKKVHTAFIPGLRTFIAEYVSDRAMGPEGYLVSAGLVPPAENERKRIRADAMTLKTMTP